jgi:hypothetical protein
VATPATAARNNGLLALKTVETVLTTIGWEPERTEADSVLRVDFSTDNIPIRDAFAEVRVDFERFLFYLNFRDRALPQTRAQTMEFVTRANFELIVGNFELNLDDGAVRFKSSIDFTGTPLTEPLVRDAIRSAMDAVEYYADALVAVVRGETTAVQALAGAGTAK